MFYNIYLLFAFLIFLFFIFVGISMQQLDIPYILACLIVSLLWLPCLIIYIIKEGLK